jgi:voltage-gated potassium channel
MNGKKRIYLPLFILMLVFLIGVGGFHFIGGGSLLDSIYMTVITLSTVGYKEAVDVGMNSAAQAFAVVFILLCVGTIAFTVSSITSFIIEGELKNILGRKKMDKAIAKLKNHYIVCGTGETAQTIIHELLLTKKKFVVVEPLKEQIEKLSTVEKALFIHGDPAEDEVLENAGVCHAKGILLSLPTDSANLFVAVSARSLNPNIRIVTKGIDIGSHKKMIKAGSDSVISPANIGGLRMVSEMIRPPVVSFLDVMLREREKVLRFEEVPVLKGSFLIGKNLMDLKLAEKTGALLVAIKRAGADKFEFNPSGKTHIHINDILIFIATPGMVSKLEDISIIQGNLDYSEKSGVDSS